MTNSKSTKRALLTSALAMLMCVAMLIGTTFAWFTDTASTAVNKIQAGNLDVKLEYLSGSDWKEVTNETKLFNEEALWEPGYTEVAYLKVSNVGNLALKYKFAVNKIEEVIGVNKSGGEIKLSKILKFGVADSDSQISYDDRATAQAAADGKALTLNSYTNDIRLGVGEAKYYAIVIYMPESVGNEANYATGTTAPSIKMGLNLVATQDTVEYDSYGYTYDQGAGNAEGYTVTAVTPVETKPKALKTSIETTITNGVTTAVEKVSEDNQVVEAGGIKVTYPANTVLATAPMAGSATGTVSSTQDATQGFVEKKTDVTNKIEITADQKATVFELTLDVAQSNTTLVKVENKISSGLNMEKVLHSGAAMAKASSNDATPDTESYYYNKDDGTFILWVYHASEIATVTSTATVYSMFPDVNVTIVSEVVSSGAITLEDKASRTTAVIPAAAVEKGIVQEGQKIYLVIQTTKLDGNEATYDISLRDANGNPFKWTTDACPSVTYDVGDLTGITDYIKIYDKGELLPYGKGKTPGWYFDTKTKLTTICSTTFE